MSWLRGITGALVAAGLSVGVDRCLKKVLIDGQVKGTREGATAVDTSRLRGSAGRGALGPRDARGHVQARALQ